MIVKGIVCGGIQHFTKRMLGHPEAFRRATGVDLVPGTINVHVLGNLQISIKAEFEIDDPMDSNQILLFERCLIEGIPAFRIRPYNRINGSGGHGDHVLEISSAQKISNIFEGAEVSIEFFRGTL